MTSFLVPAAVALAAEPTAVSVAVLLDVQPMMVFACDLCRMNGSRLLLQCLRVKINSLPLSHTHFYTVGISQFCCCSCISLQL